jgi:hypothetical protein
MTCNLERYLREQELTCRRIAKTATDGSHTQIEWFVTADILLERRREHLAVCRDCGCKSK